MSKRLIEAHIWLIVNLIRAIVKYSHTYNSVVGLHNTVTCSNNSYIHSMVIPYGGKLWRGKTLANLVNRPWFTKLKSSKLVLIINNLLGDLLVCQTFFHQMLEMNQFANVSPPKFPSIQYVNIYWYIAYN